MVKILILGWIIFFIYPGANAAGLGSISGRVTDSTTGRWLPGADIICYPWGYKTTSGVDGGYNLADLPSGTYTVTSSLSGYHYKTITGVIVSDSGFNQHRLNINLAMIPASNGMADGFESDNSRGEAREVWVDGAFSALPPQVHNFHQTGDEDWVKFYALGTISNPHPYTITTKNLGSRCDTAITLYDQDGEIIQGPVDDYPEGEEEDLSWHCWEEGYYFVRISQGQPTLFGTNSNYELSIYIPTGGLGSITGTIKNRINNFPLHGAKITTDTGGAAYSLLGGYVVVAPEGICTVNASRAGYQPSSQSGVRVWSGGETTVDLSLSPSEIAPDQLFFPHIASGNGWETEIAIINTSGDQTINGTLKPYNGSGQQVSTPMSITLPPHGRRQITMGSEFTNPDTIGYIIFETNYPSVKGYTKFYTPGVYRVAIPATNKINIGEIYLPHIASDNYWWTGLSLLNTTSDAIGLTIEFDNGTTKTISLLAKEHKAFTIAELFNWQPQPNIHSGVIKNGIGVIGLELFGGGTQLSGIPLSDDTQTKIYYPHVASDNEWWTGIVAYNPSSTPCNLTITSYTAQGIPLPPGFLSINGQDKYIGLVADLNLPNSTAWFQIESSGVITGFELFGTNDGNELAGFSGIGIGGKEGIFAKLEKNGWTGIAFVNIKSSPALVTLTAYNDNGNSIATKNINLNAHEKILGNAETIFVGHSISNATYIVYSSNKEVVGFQLNGSSDGTMLDCLPGM